MNIVLFRTVHKRIRWIVIIMYIHNIYIYIIIYASVYIILTAIDSSRIRQSLISIYIFCLYLVYVALEGDVPPRFHAAR